MRTWLRRALYVAVFLGSAGLTALMTIVFLVRTGEEVMLPSVVGKTLEEAEHLLSNRGLRFEVVRTEFSDRIARGAILSQHPSAQETVQVGRTVTAVLSKGPRERRAPRVVGLSRAAAHQVLQSSSIKFDDAAQSCSEQYGPDMVMAQDPPSGEIVSEDGLGLLISTGSCQSSFLMPNLRSRRLQDVLPLFYEAGFFTPLLHREERSDLHPGTVFLTNPRPGGTIHMFEPVELWVSTQPGHEETSSYDDPPQEPSTLFP